MAHKATGGPPRAFYCRGYHLTHPRRKERERGPKSPLSVLLAPMWHGCSPGSRRRELYKLYEFNTHKKGVPVPAAGNHERARTAPDAQGVPAGQNWTNWTPIKKRLKRRESGENSDKSDTYKKGVEQARNRRKCDKCDTHKKGVQRRGLTTDQQPNNNRTATETQRPNQGRTTEEMTQRLPKG